MIKAEGLTKRFSSLTAVDHISFRVEVGEIFGLLGPNGAGKTTTVHMLATLLKPSEGEAWVAGFSVTESPGEVRKHIGIVFQEPTVDRFLSGWDNLYIHGMIYGVPRGELKERIRKALEFVELERWAGVLVKKYSGGMLRRLELARALLYEPEVLFLDEPTLGLDPQSRAKMWEYIKELRRSQGTTILVTTHYMEEADRLCDRVAIIDRGRIVAEGSPEELKRKLGSEVIYLRSRKASELIDELREAGLSARMLSPELIALAVSSATEAMPKLFTVLGNLIKHVEEISYHRPSLEDVFLHYTGRKLRDSEADAADFIRMVARVRRW
ncbi:MAG: ABC transporter ATP-binding protein [Thermoproteota archaeon]|nr:MAG: ABC transporter ATP-binding protein [Candidatus Korarchaeota archaeon]